MTMDLRVFAASYVAAWIWLFLYILYNFYILGETNINTERAVLPIIICILLGAIDLLISIITGRLFL